MPARALAAADRAVNVPDTPWRVDGVPVGYDVFRACALDPRGSVVVSACAGAGKTSLLVGRMLRALLDGCPPDGLLAITFTRRAAAEMRARLMRLLHRLATDGETAALATLRALALDDAAARAALPVARGLLERVLAHPRPPTITTFHSWFWKLVRLAPELGLPGDARLSEGEGALADRARDAWFDSLLAPGRAGLRADLEAVVTEIGEAAFQAALEAAQVRRVELLSAAGEGARPDRERCALAAATLSGRTWGALARAVSERVGRWVATDATAVEAALRADRVLRAALSAQGDLFAQAPGRAGAIGERLRELHAGLDAGGPLPLDAATRIATDHEGRPRACPLPARMPPALRQAVEAAGGRAAAEHAWTDLRDHLDAWRALAAELDALRISDRLLRLALDRAAHAQAFKHDRGVVDFGDVELLAARLLRDESGAARVHQRLDARYRHLLFDEFQDTNALQWRIVADWLAGYGGDGPRPSVFLVGDPKQGIYRFRRADARLFEAARQLLAPVFGARWLETDATWRSAPALVDEINRCMAAHPGMLGFRPQRARRQVPGQAWRLPLAGAGETPVSRTSDRDWLLQPQRPDAMARGLDEGAGIARALLAARDAQDAAGRPVAWRDMLVLARSRTHFRRYEQALRAAGIPVRSDRSGGLLARLEVTDLVAVLRWIARPRDDLALAQVLRSPLFGVDEAQLLRLALDARAQGAGWTEVLARAAGRDGGLLARAWEALAAWRAAASTTDAHALLDRIVAERDAAARYAACVPAAEREVVRANIDALLALAADAVTPGWPGVSGFLDDLRRLGRLPARDAPREGRAAAEDAVLLTTIHGAKGLEAEVVVIADAHRPPVRERGWRPLVGWAPDAPAPSHFSFVRGSRDHAARRAWLDEEAAAVLAEDANLLYVAMTRARRVLVVSGSANRHAEADAWWRRLSHLPELRDTAVAVDLPDDGHWHGFDDTAPRAVPGARLAAPAAPWPPAPAGHPALAAWLADRAASSEVEEPCALVDADGALLEIDAWCRGAGQGWLVVRAAADAPRGAALSRLARARRVMAALEPGLRLRGLLLDATGRQVLADPDLDRRERPDAGC